MSEENVQLAREAYAAYAERGADGLLPFVDEQIEIDEAPEFPDTGMFKGHDGVLKLVALFTENFDHFRMEPQDFIPGSEDRIIAVVKLTGTARASGVPVDLQSFHVHTVRDGKSVRMQIFLNPDAAYEAAGLSE